MAIRVIKEVNREEGREVNATWAATPGNVITAGQPLMIMPGNTVQPFNGNNTSTFPVGLASENTYFFPLQGNNGLTAGAGYDYTNFNRGGLVGAFVNGGEFALYSDDNVHYPYDNTQTYTVNGPVYASAAGLITSVANGAMCGTVVAVQGSAPVTLLIIKLITM